MGKSSPHGTVRRCACAFHGSSVRKVRNIFRASRLRIPSKISAKDGAQSILKKATPGTWEYDAVPLISCFTESSCSSEICKSRVVGKPEVGKVRPGILSHVRRLETCHSCPSGQAQTITTHYTRHAGWVSNHQWLSLRVCRIRGPDVPVARHYPVSHVSWLLPTRQEEQSDYRPML